MAKFKPDTSSDFERTPKSMRSSLKLSDVKSVERGKLRSNVHNATYFRQEEEAYFKRLREDIEKRGIIVPLIAKNDGTLLAGHNRLAVAEMLNLKYIPVQYLEQVLTDDEEREFVIKDNLLRRQLSQSEWIDTYKKLYPEFEATFLNNETKTSSGRMKKGEHRLTIKDIAEDTGQSTAAIKKQLSREREKNTFGKGDNVPFSQKSLTKSQKETHTNNHHTRKTTPNTEISDEDILNQVNELLERLRVASPKIQTKVRKRLQKFLAEN